MSYHYQEKYKKVFTKQFGGIVVLFKHHFKVSFNKELSSCDVMVLSVNHLMLVNAYILPEYQARMSSQTLTLSRSS